MSDLSDGVGGGGGRKSRRTVEQDENNAETASTRGGRNWSKKQGENRSNRVSSGDGVADENLLLRRHLRKQEEKIKLLATKLVRVVGERKSKEKRDEMLIEEQKGRLAELEGIVSNLRDKLSVSREQLASVTKLIPTPSNTSHHHHHLHHLPPTPSASSRGRTRWSSGGGSPPKKQDSATVTKKGRLSSTTTTPRPRSSHLTLLEDSEFTSRVESLLLEAKSENAALEDQLRLSRERLTHFQLEAERTLSALRVAEEEVERMRAEVERGHGERVSLIRAEREARRLGGWVGVLEGKVGRLEEEVGRGVEDKGRVEEDLRKVEGELREEQEKGLSLGKKLEEVVREVGRLKEVEMAVGGLVEENRILKESHESLVEKSLSGISLGAGGSRSAGQRAEEECVDLKRQLTELEGRLKTEVGAKSELSEALREAKTKNVTLEEKVAKLEGELAEMSAKLAASEADREKRSISEEVILRAKTVEEELGQTQWQLVQVRDELDKTRALLRTQMMISRGWGKEVEELSKKLDKAESFHSHKLEEFMALLEQRTKQMCVLEETLEAIRPLANKTAPPRQIMVPNNDATATTTTSENKSPPQEQQTIVTKNNATATTTTEEIVPPTRPPRTNPPDRDKDNNNDSLLVLPM